MDPGRSVVVVTIDLQSRVISLIITNMDKQPD